MFGESYFTDGLLQDERVSFNELKSKVIEHLPAAYPRHSSSNTLKGFSIRFTVDDEYFAATAVADLKPPASLADDVDIVLEDSFMETYSSYDFWHALEKLWAHVERSIEQQKDGMLYAQETREGGG